MAAWRIGHRNLLTDVAGLRVGNAEDERLKSGVTAVLCDEPAVASVMVLGGAPGTRETDLLAPENTVERIDALVLSGGSAFGLDAASGVQAVLREAGRGFKVGDVAVPIVPAAILFDLLNGGDKSWGRFPPYRKLGAMAAERAGVDFAIGSVGAGTGALTAKVKGGLGSASFTLESGVTVAALVAVNAVGSPLVGDTRHFWAAPFEADAEYGGLGLPHPLPGDASMPRTKFSAAPGGNTTIAVIATDAILDKAGARRLAVAAHDGFARALWPAHTDMDGDLVFSLATGGSGQRADGPQRIELAAAASAAMARAIARGVFAAEARPGDRLPAWKDLR
ncbi:P1 family peptidase [Consotaella salsifontis]|uniref:L-aminopeptidase/D-esterase n=1 Tax=Consotaella salsifontis TaxID=1365950 RepID=A0A1T4L3I9_9HYPH|nr:P1 family peptidase [Consotaella salsifontis]SJZ49302.1 L-aminopeptidase/D-esterase [Consotaella salsifontis]